MKLTESEKIKMKNLRSKMNNEAYRSMIQSYLSMRNIIKLIKEEDARGEIPYNLGDD
jgi:hypothetical protein